MRKTIFGLFLIGIFATTVHAQSSTLQGYIFEDGNQGPIEAVEVQILESTNNQLVTSTATNKYGIFLAKIPVGKTYTIQAKKSIFNPQATTVIIKSSDTDKKVYTKLKMTRKAGTANNFTERAGILSKPAIQTAVENYGIDSKQIVPTANPDGVPLSDLIAQNDPYAEVTNATRLVDENYEGAADREAMKYEKIPTAYNSTVKVKLAQPTNERAPNRDIPTNYNKATEDKKIIIPNPQFGETLVKSANDLARTNAIPAYYTGHKIEFITSFTELPASHEIFKRHGNITMERRPNGIFSYLIGDFTDAAIGEQFLEESMLDRYPSANLVTYENGKRGIKKNAKKVKTKPVSPPPR